MCVSDALKRYIIYIYCQKVILLRIESYFLSAYGQGQPCSNTWLLLRNLWSFIVKVYFFFVTFKIWCETNMTLQQFRSVRQRNNPSKSVTVGPGRFIVLNDSANSKIIMKIYFNFSDFLKAFWAAWMSSKHPIYDCE